MNDLLDFEMLKVTIASPEQIKGWSFGEVTKPETINYRTLKAEKDGLFSENIFGPTKDYECYCGKYKRIRYRGVICDKCGVEVTQSRVRRERMGHISLAAPVAHVWYVKGAPSKLSLILDISPKNLEAVIYFASYLIIEVDQDKKTRVLSELEENLKNKKEELGDKLKKEIKLLEDDLKKKLQEVKKNSKEKEKLELLQEEMQLKVRQEVQKLRDNMVVEETQLESIYKTVADLVRVAVPLKLLSEEEYAKLEEYGAADFVKVGMGADSLLAVLQNLNIDKLSAMLREEVARSSGARHIKATKRLRIVEGMRSAGIRPEWMVMRILPVLPPDLRPMVQLPGGRFATSDLNDLYRRVINRNNRLSRLINLGAPEIILRNEKRMLQEAVDSLIDTAQKTSRRASDHVLRSLSDMLRGKQGRFRQNLLGKRVDYSGRSVIVVGPKLALNQVGLPKEMALEMFKPFVLREMIAKGLASNVKGAKNVLETRSSEVWDILEEIIEGHPILINRAPTLHRLGIQAFFPVLVEGNAIRIHPCICAGFNADFDGDQMAIHVPLSQKAQNEAKDLMMARENILKPSDASPITLPNKEMALGCYYVTSLDPNIESPDDQSRVYGTEEAVMAFKVGAVKLRALIRIKIGSEILTTTVGRLMFNNILPVELRFINEGVSGAVIKRIITTAFNGFDRDVIVKLIDDIKNLGFWGATIAGVSVGLFDNKISKEKDKLISKAEREVAEIEGNLKKGLITNDERKMLSQGVWIKTTDEVAKLTWQEFQGDNPVKIIVDSGGARATSEQIKQLSGMRGLSVDPTGNIVELPTKSNYRQGLSVFEYFTSARGARKGVADKALKTADAGYLTRRLVDVAHDVIIRSEDCGSEEGLELLVPEGSFQSANSRFLGRKLLHKVVDPKSKKTISSAGDFLEEEQIKQIMASGVEKITVRSPLTCQYRFGLCIACYGFDLTTRASVKIGTPVGVVAAQSIGEPGTQLTMRTFHTGGIVGMDITSGLPRVEELFEGRIPKAAAPISEIAGKVSILTGDGGVKIRVRTTQKPHDEREYIVPVSANLLVEDGQLISAGTPLSSGHLDIKEILKVRGLKEAQRYIVDEVRSVYETQGVPINEKHFEVIVRKMSDKVRVESQGNTNLLPGEIVDKLRFEEENQRVLAGGGDPATASVVILGITRASLQTESFLSAASFQETTSVLSEAAALGKIDRLIGLKENVIIGRLIPTSPERAVIEG